MNKVLSLIALTLAVSAPLRAETVASVVVLNRGFHPALVRVHAGDVVEFRNTSTTSHTVTADPARAANPANVILPPGAIPFHSGEVAPGASFRHTFTVPGRYRFVCLPHETMGMIGEVIVE